MRILVFGSLTLLAATWAGYPAVVWLIGLLRRQRPASGVVALPRVTVVVASRDGDDVIRERVRNLLESDYPGELLDVVVAIDATRVARVPDASSIAPTRIAFVPGDAPGGKATALNAAVRSARGEVLVFTDTAQRFERGTVAALVDELQRNPTLAAVSGELQIGEPDAPPSVATLYWRFERWLRRAEARIHSPVGVTGAVYAMRRAAWVDLPAGLILDDLYVPMVQVLSGRRIGFRRDAVAVDPRRIDGRGEYHRKTRTLTGVFQLCHLLPSVLVPLRNPIWLQFVFHKLLRLATPYLLALLVAASCGWLLVTLPARTALISLGACLLTGALVLAASSRVRRLVRDIASMQAAVVQATRNAFRGEWDVWRG
ncbi:MAG: glycosyltransferase [Gemmatimonadaceae bacterium]